METTTDLSVKLHAMTLERDTLLEDNRILKDALHLTKADHARRMAALREAYQHQDAGMISVEEFARLGRMSRRTLDRMKKARPDFPQARMLSGRHLYVRDECLDWILSQTV